VLTNQDRVWSIGIYTGASPFSLSAPPGLRNPVLTHGEVSDIPAAFLADPFMVREKDVWYMFFEIMPSDVKRGVIGLATSRDALRWKYQQVVLTEPFHLSYPDVFKWRGQYYMIPETGGDNRIRLYRATSFPYNWSCAATFLPGPSADSSVFRHDGRWWLYTCTTPYLHHTLRLYYSERLEGPWREHLASPIVENDDRIARPGGRVLKIRGRLIRYAQDCHNDYGSQVRAFWVRKLTTGTYQEEEIEQSPVLTPSGSGWNQSAMHQIDLHCLGRNSWLACVDGRSGALRLKVPLPGASK
jgi:hypothetical protein